MRINTPNEYEGKRKPEEPDVNWGKGKGIDDPMPMKPPEIHSPSEGKAKGGRKSQAIRKGPGGYSLDEEGRPLNKDGSLDKRFRDNVGLTKASLKRAPQYEARPKTVWMRKDIWLAVEMFAESSGRSQRSVLEEACYQFLIEKGRVTNIETLGTEEDKTSWNL
jgi:hypothetical protein